MSRQERKSNYELLRIVSMFFIVIYHVIIHGHVIENTNNTTLQVILYIIILITTVHVNSFILVTGYFQCESKFKFSKVLSLCNASFFYRALVLIILISLGVMSFDTLKLFQELSYIRLWYYWFVRVYIYLYCLSPFINYLINVLYKEHLLIT